MIVRYGQLVSYVKLGAGWRRRGRRAKIGVGAVFTMLLCSSIQHRVRYRVTNFVEECFRNRTGLELDSIVGDFDDVDLLGLALAGSTQGESMNRVQAIGRVERMRRRGTGRGWTRA